MPITFWIWSFEKMNTNFVNHLTKELKTWRFNEKGFLVPTTKKKDIVRMATFPSDFRLKEIGGSGVLNPDGKLEIGGIANEKSKDRMNEVLNPTGIDVSGYQKNPVLLLQHNHSCPIGLVTVLRPEENGVHFEGWVGDPKAAPLTASQTEARSLIAQKILKAVSVGFIPLKMRPPAYDEMGALVEPLSIEEWEMLELSVVAVPCNAGSLFEMKDHKQSKNKNGKLWAFPSLSKDGNFIINKEIKKMDDELKDSFKALGDSLNSIASGINALKEQGSQIIKAVETKGKKPPKDDGADQEPDSDEDDKKKKALDDRFKALEDGLSGVSKSVEKLFDTVKLLAEKIPSA
jgi:phage head maturation protease